MMIKILYAPQICFFRYVTVSILHKGVKRIIMMIIIIIIITGVMKKEHAC